MLGMWDTCGVVRKRHYYKSGAIFKILYIYYWQNKLREMRTFIKGRRAIDSKYSWLVCLSATVGLTLMDGFALSFGVYQPVLKEYFDENKEKTSRAGSITIALVLFSGPFAVFLTDRFGFRPIAVISAFLCSLSLLLSSFVNSIIVLYFAYSILFGTCGGVIFNICYGMTRMYFDKYWSIAAGILTSGSNIGILIMTQSNEVLIENFGWKTSFRVMSGVMVLMFLAFMVFLPLQNNSKNDQESIEMEQKEIAMEQDDFIKEQRGTTMEQDDIIKEQRGTIMEQDDIIIEERGTTMDNDGIIIEQRRLLINQNDIKEERNVNSNHCKNLKKDKGDPQQDTLLEATNCKVHSELDSKKVETNQKQRIPDSAKRQITLKDVGSLFKNMTFVVALIATVLSVFGAYTPHIHLAQFSMDLGISNSQSAQLYIYFAISNIVARLLIGPIVNRVKLRPLHALQLSILASGISIFCLSFAKLYIHLIAFCVAFGLSNGCLITMRAIFFMSVVGGDKSRLSLGLMTMVSSAAVASGPPFAGYLADSTGSYVTSFRVIGSIMVFASILPLVLCLKQFKDQNEQNYNLAQRDKD